MADYVLTIDSDDERIPASKNVPDDALDPDFVFDLSGDTYADVGEDLASGMFTSNNPVCFAASS